MQPNPIGKEIIAWSKSFIIILTVSILFTVFIFQPYIVSGSSMEPTFQGYDSYDNEKVGDRVFIFKTPYLLGVEPEHGDMVIIDSSINEERTLKDDFLDSPLVRILFKKKQGDYENKFWIKRVIGKPGDTIEFVKGKVYRNGEELTEPYIKEKMMFPFETVEVPDNHVFLMGDNRNASYDSRQIGPIPTDHIVGKVSLRFYPFNKISVY